MKKNNSLICLLLISCSFMSVNAASKIDRDSTLALIPPLLDDIGFRIRGLDRYKLYPTENIYTFLKLDTLTGRIEQLQWSLDSENEGSVSINDMDLSTGTGCGTFELYPTQNMYQFILLNKVTGQSWHVQWGMEYGNRWIRKIY